MKFDVTKVQGRTMTWDQTDIEGYRDEKKRRTSASDATTSSSLIISLIMMSLDDFLPSKMAIFVDRK